MKTRMHAAPSMALIRAELLRSVRGGRAYLFMGLVVLAGWFIAGALYPWGDSSLTMLASSSQAIFLIYSIIVMVSAGLPRQSVDRAYWRKSGVVLVVVLGHAELHRAEPCRAPARPAPLQQKGILMDNERGMMIRHVMCVFAVAVALMSCGKPAEDSRTANQVVVYVALDEMFSRPILDRFEQETGIRVVAQYDTEASKTTGLVNRLLAERSRPRADVFWNNEVVQTIRLKNEGALTPYRSPAGDAIPGAFKDADGYWTGLAARGRVIIYNTDLVSDPPTSIHDFLDPRWNGKAAIARPLFGTTATHAAALFARWGEAEARKFFEGLKANNVAILPGNATVRDLVAQGEYAIGLTDTDDANGAVEDGLPAKWLFPDQGPDELGALIIPNSVALIAGGPNPEGGKRLIDYLLSAEVEAALARTRSIQIPLNPDVERPENVPDLASVRAMNVDFEEVERELEPMMAYINEHFAP